MSESARLAPVAALILAAAPAWPAKAPEPRAPAAGVSQPSKPRKASPEQLQDIARQAVPYANLACRAYPDKDCSVDPAWKPAGSHDEEAAGFHARTFRHDGGQVVVAFTGREGSELDSWDSDLCRRGFGSRAARELFPGLEKRRSRLREKFGDTCTKFDMAAAYAALEAARLGRSDLLLAGHAFGGSLAQFAGQALGLRAYTFDSSGIMSEELLGVLNEEELADPSQIVGIVNSENDAERPGQLCGTVVKFDVARSQFPNPRLRPQNSASLEGFASYLSGVGSAAVVAAGWTRTSTAYSTAYYDWGRQKERDAAIAAALAAKDEAKQSKAEARRVRESNASAGEVWAADQQAQLSEGKAIHAEAVSNLLQGKDSPPEGAGRALGSAPAASGEPPAGKGPEKDVIPDWCDDQGQFCMKDGKMILRSGKKRR